MRGGIGAAIGAAASLDGFGNFRTGEVNGAKLFKIILDSILHSRQARQDPLQLPQHHRLLRRGRIRLQLRLANADARIAPRCSYDLGLRRQSRRPASLDIRRSDKLHRGINSRKHEFERGG